MSDTPRPEIAVDGFAPPKRAGWIEMATSADH